MTGIQVTQQLRNVICVTSRVLLQLLAQQLNLLGF
jgi:hypothetical protein